MTGIFGYNEGALFAELGILFYVKIIYIIIVTRRIGAYQF